MSSPIQSEKTEKGFSSPSVHDDSQFHATDVDLEKQYALKTEAQPYVTVTSVDSELSQVFETLAIREQDHDIKFRTMGWKKTAALLFAEYICLAIMSFPWSFSILGFVPGTIVSVGVGAFAWYTSYVLWQYCILHPHIRDLVDVGAQLFNGNPIARELTAVGLILNNIFIMGFHTFTGSKILNTLTNHATCTNAFVIVFLVICIFLSLPRTLSGLTTMSVISALFMGTAVLLAIIFSGVEDHPGAPYPSLGPVKATAFPAKGTTFVNGLNAVLNITFTYVGQALLPSFIAEMRDPRDFPKALAACTIAEIIVFTLTGGVVYHYLGQYTQAPAFGSLIPNFEKISFSLATVPTIVIAVIYASVESKFIFNRVLANSRHRYSNTWTGWGVWVGIVVSTWILGMVIGEAIPFFGDLLSLMSALFDSFFGFMFWAVAYYHINRRRLFKGVVNTAFTVLNIIIFAIGVFMLGPGLYTSVQAIITDYESGPVKVPFSCANNAI